MMMDGMGMMSWGVFSFLLGLLLIFVVMVVAAVEWLWGKGTPFVTEHRDGALDIVKKRYARGEISKEQFQQMKKDIE